MPQNQHQQFESEYDEITQNRADGFHRVIKTLQSLYSMHLFPYKPFLSPTNFIIIICLWKQKIPDITTCFIFIARSINMAKLYSFSQQESKYNEVLWEILTFIIIHAFIIVSNPIITHSDNIRITRKNSTDNFNSLIYLYILVSSDEIQYFQKIWISG